MRGEKEREGGRGREYITGGRGEIYRREGERGGGHVRRTYSLDSFFSFFSRSSSIAMATASLSACNSSA